jgi:hypothetical protein
MTTRQEASAILARGDRLVHELLDGLPEDTLVESATIGGGDWSAKDLVGHLTLWEEEALTTIEECRRGERPSIDAVFTDDGTDELNDREVERRAGTPLDEVRARAADVHERLLAELAAMTDQEWAQPPAWEGSPHGSLGEVLGGILGAPEQPFGHTFAHEADLRAFAAARRASDRG